MSRYLLSPCCNAFVYVPVEVTAHLYVLGNGAVSKSIADSLSGIRRQAIFGDVEPGEAYCAACGGPVPSGGEQE